MLRVIFMLIPICLWSSIVLATDTFIDYDVAGKTYSGYYISPDPKAPLIILVHDWDGLTEYEKKRSKMLADEGYAVFAIDMFGKDVRPQTTAEKKQLTGALYKDRQKMRTLVEEAFSAIEKEGANTTNAIAMGYCFGGSVVLEYARSGKELKGFVAFHGGLATPEGQNYAQTQGKLLIFHGSADKAVSMNDFAALAIDLEKNNISHEMITYSGAPHAFTVFGSSRYHQEADEKSWQRFTEYLKDTL